MNICCLHSSIWYLRKSSYQSHFYKALSEDFPDSGERVMVYVGGVRYWEHIDEMRRIQAVLDDSDYIRDSSVDQVLHDFNSDLGRISSNLATFTTEF